MAVRRIETRSTTRTSDSKYGVCNQVIRSSIKNIGCVGEPSPGRDEEEDAQSGTLSHQLSFQLLVGMPAIWLRLTAPQGRNASPSMLGPTVVFAFADRGEERGGGWISVAGEVDATNMPHACECWQAHVRELKFVGLGLLNLAA